MEIAVTLETETYPFLFFSPERYSVSGVLEFAMSWYGVMIDETTQREEELFSLGELIHVAMTEFLLESDARIIIHGDYEEDGLGGFGFASYAQSVYDAWFEVEDRLSLGEFLEERHEHSRLSSINQTYMEHFTSDLRLAFNRLGLSYVDFEHSVDAHDYMRRSKYARAPEPLWHYVRNYAVTEVW
jgi:hypothetical protein